MVNPPETNCNRYRGCLDPSQGFPRVSDYIFVTPQVGDAGRSWVGLLLALLSDLVSEPSRVPFALPLAWLLIPTNVTC